MEQKELYHYQVLQLIVFNLLRQPEFFLQPEKWPLEIDRQLFFTYLTNLLNLEYQENLSELLTNAFQKITEILAGQVEGQTIPLDLQKTVEDYENYLRQREEQLKQNPSYWEYYQKLLEAFSRRDSKNPLLAKENARQVTQTIARQIAAKGVGLEEYQGLLEKNVEQTTGVQLTPQELLSLAESTYASATSLATTPSIPTPPPPEVSPLGAGLAKARLVQLANVVSGLPPEIQSSAQEVVSQLEKEIVGTVIAGNPPSPEEYSQIVSQVVAGISEAKGIPPQQAVKIERKLISIGQEIIPQTKKATTTLQQVTEVLKTQPEIAGLSPEQSYAVLEEVKTEITPLILGAQPPSSQQIQESIFQAFKKRGASLPPIEQVKAIGEKTETSIINTLISFPEEKPQGVAFKPVFTLLYPPTAISAVKKIALAPIVKTLQWMVKIAPENIPEETKTVILEGLTTEDIQESINAFQEAGLSSKHPKIDQLKNQKDKLTSFESSHPVLSFILRHYHEFSKKTGSRQIQESKTGLWLPKLSPSTSWQKQKGYAWILQRGLNRLGVFLKTHQWLPSRGGKIIRFVLPDKIVRTLTFGKIQSFVTLKKAVYQKIIQPVLIWLGKTAVGKAIKTGVKKLASWGLAKLGISLAGAAVGAAAGPPGWVATLISFIPNIISWVKRGIKKLLEKPELAILFGIGLVGLPILLPMFPALGFIFTTLGIFSVGIGFLAKGGSFIAGVAGKIGGLLSTTTSTISGLLSSFSTIPLPSVLPTIAVGGSVALTTFLTLLTVITRGGAFLEEGKGEVPPYIGSPVSPRPPDQSGHLAEVVIWTLNNCGITMVNKETWSKTEKCLSNSTLPNKQIIISQFHYSVFEVGPGLQCVGFVRGVMAALGKDPGGGRHAREYLNPPTPSGYYPANTDVNNVQIGDLVIWKGGSYGHIAIVVNIVEKNGIKYLHVAEAIGTNNGIIRINEVNAVYFDGFLRPI